MSETEPTTDRTWTEADMDDMAARIATRAHERLQAQNQFWRYAPMREFRDVLIAEARYILVTVLRHERAFPAQKGDTK